MIDCDAGSMMTDLSFAFVRVDVRWCLPLNALLLFAGEDGDGVVDFDEEDGGEGDDDEGDDDDDEVICRFAYNRKF